MKQVNIVCPDNAVGLTQDATIIKSLLERNGISTTISSSQTPNNNHKYELNIFCEVVYPNYFSRAVKNVLIPNPEWFYQKWKPYLHRFNRILCKTHHAYSLFGTLGNYSVRFIGFTSNDKLDSTITRENTFAHFAGKSSHKGTEQLLKAVMNSKVDIHVTVYSHNPNINFINRSLVNRERVTIVTERLTDYEIKQAQNKHRFHICTSKYEGFGHYINEARSVGAVIITTNAPPMNELITPEFGFGVSCVGGAVHGLVTLNEPQLESILGAMISASHLDEESINIISVRARQAYIDEKEQFEELFINNIKELIQ